MDYLRQVQRAVDHIEAHLDDPLALEDISRVAGVSHWHFQRMFRALTQESLKGYIRSRRLSRARIQLLETERPVLDIALSAGFASQASFTRAFKAQHGCTPAACRAEGGGRVPLGKVPLDAVYVRHLQDRVSLEPQLVESPERHMVGIPTAFESMEANRLGGHLQPLWEAFPPRFHEVPDPRAGTAYGVICTSDPGRLEYVAALEVNGPPAVLPEGMTHVVIPACTWAVFAHRGPVAGLDHTVNYIYACWLLQSGRAHAYHPDLEIYDHRFSPGDADSVVDYAIPLKG